MPILRSRNRLWKPQPLDNENGVVGWWGFDDGQAGDSSGKGNKGSLLNASPPIPTQAFIPGLALKFSGSSSYVSIPHSATMNVGDNFTLAIWAKRGAINVKQCLMDKGTNAFYIGFLVGNTVELGKSGIANIATSSATITDTEWHHICATKNGATSKLYFDGIDVTGAVTNSTIANTSSPVTIGVTNDTVSIPFTGGLDDARVYLRDLSPSEVNAEYNIGRSIYTSPDEWEMPPINSAGFFSRYYYDMSRAA